MPVAYHPPTHISCWLGYSCTNQLTFYVCSAQPNGMKFITVCVCGCVGVGVCGCVGGCVRVDCTHWSFSRTRYTYCRMGFHVEFYQICGICWEPKVIHNTWSRHSGRHAEKQNSIISHKSKHRVGRIHTLYMTVSWATSLPKIPYIQTVYTVYIL